MNYTSVMNVLCVGVLVTFVGHCLRNGTLRITLVFFEGVGAHLKWKKVFFR